MRAPPATARPARRAGAVGGNLVSSMAPDGAPNRHVAPCPRPATETAELEAGLLQPFHTGIAPDASALADPDDDAGGDGVIAVMYEDRPQSLIGVKLAALSLARHSPGLRIVAWVPEAPSDFLEWSRRLPALEVRTSRDGIAGNGWNVKPSVLLATLEEGHSAAMWLDSDVMVTGDLAARLGAIDAGTVVSSEEYYWGHHQGTPYRSLGIGLQPGRVLAATVNTCILRVSPDHLDLLRRWRTVLGSAEYLAAQARPLHERPIYFCGDQEVLTGLLGSSDYAAVPLVQLKRGVEVAQCFGPSGYTVRERLRTRKTLPLLIHAMGRKPWLAPAAAGSSRGLHRMRWALDNIHRDLTPYVALAGAYREDLDEEADWLLPRTRTGAGLTWLARGSPVLRELPLAMVDSSQRWVRRRLGVGQISPTSS